jgi:hypothetical protein
MPSQKSTLSQIPSDIEIAQATTPLPIDRLLLGAMSTMPGLPTHAAYYDIDLDLNSGRVIGLA